MKMTSILNKVGQGLWITFIKMQSKNIPIPNITNKRSNMKIITEEIHRVQNLINEFSLNPTKLAEAKALNIIMFKDVKPYCIKSFDVRPKILDNWMTIN
jgi:hypothetical protein